MSTSTRRRAWLGALLLAGALFAGSWYVVESGAQGEGTSAQAQTPNELGWRAGTAWTVRMDHYATYLAEPDWVSADYHFQVVGAEAGTFIVSVRFADGVHQPASARSELMRAAYTVRNEMPTLAWVQLEGRGPQLSPEEAVAHFGGSFFSLELPANPFTTGESVRANTPGGREVEARRVSYGRSETALVARGIPWWLSYSKGDELRAQLISFEN